mmetsp:Transcript_43836/g.93840  ORF Transcript_43836/g.93840 Transcript_43836/m.93840 type:complete len:135 (+) Transcript_43836:225-629(+)
MQTPPSQGDAPCVGHGEYEAKTSVGRMVRVYHLPPAILGWKPKCFSTHLGTVVAEGEALTRSSQGCVVSFLFSGLRPGLFEVSPPKAQDTLLFLAVGTRSSNSGGSTPNLWRGVNFWHVLDECPFSPAVLALDT